MLGGGGGGAKGMMHESCSFPPKKNMPEHAIFFQNNLIKPSFYDHPSFSSPGPIVNQNFLHWRGIILTTGRGLTENILPLNGGQKSAINIIC